MVVRREKKSRKMHGYRTRGYGNVGQHRKSGCKGGVGAAGMHKHMWSWVIKYFPDWFGKHGFTPRGPEHTPVVTTINVGRLNEIAQDLLRKGAAVKEGELIVIDTTKMGIAKVLSSGKVTLPLKVIAYSVSERAKEKIEAAGGKVVLVGSKAAS